MIGSLKDRPSPPAPTRPQVQVEPADAYRNENGVRKISCKRSGVGYRGYVIQEKADFGRQPYLVLGFPVSHGYVVTDGRLINVMPGGAWFLTVEDCMRAIDDLIEAEATPMDQQGSEHPFWARNRLRRECEERAPELALLLQEIVDAGVDGPTTTLLSRAAVLLDEIDVNCDKRATSVTVEGVKTKLGVRIMGRFGLRRESNA